MERRNWTTDIGGGSAFGYVLTGWDSEALTRFREFAAVLANPVLFLLIGSRRSRRRAPPPMT